MSWKHDMARALRQRDNKTSPAWFRGEVLSPIKRTEDGETIYEGPLVISCLGGDVMLRADALKQLAGAAQAAGEERLHDGMSVALTGDLGTGEPGSLQILILGVVQDAF